MTAPSPRERKALRVGVIGPAGFSGSYLCVELIQRGHHVIGLSRHPEALGTHALYEAKPIDLDSISIEDFASALQGLDVLVSAYGPHTAGADALQYMPFLELTRKIILSVKLSRVPYFIMIGGAGSLHLPNSPYGSCLIDSPHWFFAYRRAIADSEAHTSYMEERLGPLGSSLRKYRNARLALRAGTATETDHATMSEYEEMVKRNDRAANFIKGCRTSFLFFEGNESFRWTYVSPSPLYRPGKRTGEYEVQAEGYLLKERKTGEEEGENPLEGKLSGISAADLAVAIADEVETQKLVFKHWTAVGGLEDDTPTASYVTL